MKIQILSVHSEENETSILQAACGKKNKKQSTLAATFSEK